MIIKSGYYLISYMIDCYHQYRLENIAKLSIGDEMGEMVDKFTCMMIISGVKLYISVAWLEPLSGLPIKHHQSLSIEL